MKDGQLDETDRQILRTLSRDGRISNQKLAETVHLSPTPCWHRVKTLEEAGYISKTRDGRRNRYSINPGVRMRHPMDQEHHIGELVDLLAKPSASPAPQD